MFKKLLFFLIIGVIETYAHIPAVTIFVHGSQNATKYLSRDIWFCKKGLHSINDLPDSSCFFKDAKLLQQCDGTKFPLEHYYTFGWLGKVDFKVREQAGKELFDDLKQLLQRYKFQYGACPRVCFITHSHGGNVVLNMLKHFPIFAEDSVYLELIILACPVQKVTEKLIEHPAIARSYVMYSTFDLIQLLDIYKYQGKHYFPRRCFETQQKNCTQILVKVNNHRLCHTDFTHSIVRHIPEIIQIVGNRYGHVECNINDSGFVFYNGFNLVNAMKAHRKNIKI